MFRGLVDSLTGLRSDEVNHRRCRHNPPTCKTHWPAYDRTTNVAQFSHFAEHGILLLRNPARALPSWCNWRWESAQRLPTHSRIAPVDVWVAWRDKMFLKEIKRWRNLLTQWRRDVPSVHIQLYIPYEELTNPDSGPVWLERVHDLFREQSPATPLVPVAELPCLWQRTVKGEGAAKTRRSGERYAPPYTAPQKALLLTTLDGLLAELAVDVDNNSGDDGPSAQLAEILRRYRRDIDENLVIQ